MDRGTEARVRTFVRHCPVGVRQRVSLDQTWQSAASGVDEYLELRITFTMTPAVAAMQDGLRPREAATRGLGSMWTTMDPYGNLPRKGSFASR